MLARIAACLSLLLFSLPAHAEDAPVTGAPQLWGIDMQTAYSPVKHMMYDFHNHLLLPLTIGISVFVLALLIYVALRYNSKANPVAQQFAHNTTIEVIWTAVPVLILLVMVIPSYKLLYFLDKAHKPEMTLKVTGHQWYWSYEYPDQKIESFDSRPIWDGNPQKPEAIDAALKDASPNWIYNQDKPLRLLEVDNRVVLPVDTEVRVYVTGADVIHSWGIAAFGTKEDANPGKLNETWVKIDKPGLYYGQCSELCGTGHGFMPIVIEAVSKDKFAEWVAKKATPETPAAAPGAKPSAPAAPANDIKNKPSPAPVKGNS